MSRIGVFGGTFDPPHLGHLLAAQLALEELNLDEVLFTPTHESYHKGPTGASATERLRMVELATAGIDAFSVSRLEIDRGGPSYTIDTLHTLGAGSGGNEYTLIMGSDSFATFDSWRQSKEIRNLVQLAVISRPGGSRHPQVETFGDRVRVLGPALCSISSALCRERFAAGRSNRLLIPDSVLGFIFEHGLYGSRA